jgi:hypothetical protein
MGVYANCGAEGEFSDWGAQTHVYRDFDKYDKILPEVGVEISRRSVLTDPA